MGVEELKKEGRNKSTRTKNEYKKIRKRKKKDERLR